MLTDVNLKNFDQTIKEGVSVVDFYADWCGPCKMLGPILESFSKKREDIKIIKIDVDKEEELAQRYQVMSIPTLILFKDGELISLRQGFMTEDMITEWLKETE